MSGQKSERRRRNTPVAGVMLLAGLGVLAFSGLRAASEQLPSVAGLLDRYMAGEAEAVAKAVVEVEAASGGAVLAELRSGGVRWLGRASDAAAARQRRLVAAALALEAAGAPSYATTTGPDAPVRATIARFGTPFGLSRRTERWDLLSWGLEAMFGPDRLVAVTPAVGPGGESTNMDSAERLWFLGSLALLAGAGDVDLEGPLQRMSAAQPAPFLPGILLDAAQRRFPDEPRFRMAAAFADERRTYTLGQSQVIAISTRTPEDDLIPPALLDRREPPQASGPAKRRAASREEDIREALSMLDGVGGRYEALAGEPAVRAEALLRLGYHRLRVGDRPRALEAFAEAVPGPADAHLQYLTHFFRGWTLHRIGRREEAERDYEAALRLHPGSRQVRTLLAALLDDRGERAEALSVLGAFLQRPPNEQDPWSTFKQGDYRFWPQRMAALREAVR